MTSADDLGYASAMEELERILSEIERDEVDVDALADKVARAGELIRVCRQKISSAQMEVERVIGELGDQATDVDEVDSG